MRLTLPQRSVKKKVVLVYPARGETDAGELRPRHQKADSRTHDIKSSACPTLYPLYMYINHKTKTKRLPKLF